MVDKPLRERPATIVVTAAMAEAGRKAMIDWYEGDDDFGPWALAIFCAVARAGGYKVVEDAPKLGVKTPKLPKRHPHGKAL